MKKMIFFAALALFNVSVFAQTGTSVNEHGKFKNPVIKGKKIKDKEKKGDNDLNRAASDDQYDLNKDGRLDPEEKAARREAGKAEHDAVWANRKDAELDRYDLNKNGRLDPEEREARQTAKKAEHDARQADREDDGILNGSVNDYDNHGATVSTVARGTTLEGREKGEAVSTAARSRSGNGASAARPAHGKPAGAGRPAGAGHSGK